jgi:protocatechuate 3,4-dioxygenase beta subunit
MFDKERRKFLQHTSLGLAAAGVSGLVLRTDAQPTPASVNEENAARVLIQMGAPPKEVMAAKGELKKIPPMSYGPAYKPGAPFRAKLCSPFEVGTTFVMTGRIWAFDSKRPLQGVVLDMWHVDHQGKYSNGDGDFKNRGRLVSNEAGYYEFESIRPVPYQPNPSDGKFWRCAHFHLLAVCPGYKPLVTEIHFKDDPKQKMDQMYNPELAVAVEKRVVNGKNFETAVFDIVLERETNSN